MSSCWRRVSNTGRCLCYLHLHPSHKLQRVNRTLVAGTSDVVANSEGLLGHNIYISASLDPYFNLSLEDWYVYGFLLVSLMCDDSLYAKQVVSPVLANIASTLDLS